jgi:hypothetical protein
MGASAVLPGSDGARGLPVLVQQPPREVAQRLTAPGIRFEIVENDMHALGVRETDEPQHPLGGAIDEQQGRRERRPLVLGQLARTQHLAVQVDHFHIAEDIDRDHVELAGQAPHDLRILERAARHRDTVQAGLGAEEQRDTSLATRDGVIEIARQVVKGLREPLRVLQTLARLGRCRQQQGGEQHNG